MMVDVAGQIQVCPRCKRKLPIMAEPGKHNFCPVIVGKGKIINVCMECKIIDNKMKAKAATNKGK